MSRSEVEPYSPDKHGYPNEHLNQTEMKEMSSPMYSTGIGIVIETIARMEHDEYLRVSKAAEATRHEPQPKAETILETPDAEDVVIEKEDTEDKKKKKKGVDLKKIVTTFTEFFTPDNIE